MKPAFFVGGMGCLALGFVGAFLPVLPTTPFVLLAAYCFSRSSDRWHDWLRNSKRFGAVVRSWEDEGSVPQKAKLAATVAMIVVAVGLWVSPALVLVKIATTGAQAAVLVFIWTRPLPAKN